MKSFIKTLSKGFIILLFIIIAFVFGFMAGKQHTITDSKISLENGLVYLEIDENIYVHNVD